MRRFGMVLVVALGLVGCSSAKQLTKQHGRSYRAFLDRQAFRGAAATPSHREAVKGLDAQEAGIVARSYRESLAPKDARPREEPQVLIMKQPTGRGGPAAPLAPSVPRD